MDGKFVAYYRVSTERQGRSGLGLDAQRDAVSRHLDGGSWSLLGEFTEIESGRNNARPQLAAGHRQLVGLRSRSHAIWRACSWLRRSGDTGDLGPNLKGTGPGGSILDG